MTRFTVGNVVKVVAAVLLGAFSAFLLLVIGAAAKNKKVALEGGIYAGVFLLAVFALQTGPASGLFGLGSMAMSIVRSIWLRDLWLPARPRKSVVGNSAQPMLQRSISTTNVQHPDSPAVAQRPFALVPGAQPFGPVPVAQPVAPLPSAATKPASVPSGAGSDLSAALGWVSSIAKQNKHRLPADAYTTILEVCQTLDAVVDAESRQPSVDAAFEYELGAMVRQYLPAVMQGYLSVPAHMVGVAQPNGRTPNDELREQLQLLSGQADALHGSRFGQNSAQLSSMGNFLRDRFAHRRPDGFDFGIK